MLTKPSPPLVGRRDIMGHPVGCNKKSSLCNTSTKNRLPLKHRIIPSQETAYQMTNLESSNMINLMKNQRHREELFHIKETPERWQLGPTYDPELEPLPLQRCWNKLVEFESDLRGTGSAEVLYTVLAIFLSSENMLPFPPGLEFIYVLSCGLVHQLLDFRIHSWFSQLAFPSAWSIGNLHQCWWKAGGEGERERERRSGGSQK